MRVQISRLIRCLALCTLLSGTSATAEPFGLPNGRAANPGSLYVFSIEGGFVGGRFVGAGYQHFGLRVNYRLGQRYTVYGDLSLRSELGDGGSEIGMGVGHPVGIGVYIYSGRQNMAFKFSFHRGSFDGNSIVETDYEVGNIEALFNFQLIDSGLSLYGNFGLQKIKAEFGRFGDNNGFGLGVGTGLMLPVGAGIAYAGVDLSTASIQYSIGYRHLVQ